jgi:hypothetical protein
VICVESISPNGPSPDQSESDALQSELDALVARTGAAATAVNARPDAGRLTLMLVGAAGIIAGVAFVLALSWLRGEAPLQTAAAAPARPAPATKPAQSVIVESAPAPTWTGERKATWASDGSKTIAFELQAMRDVPVWMSKARPVLVVQCLSRATRSFVILGASANFEEDAFRRTVRVQWDDGPTMVQQWQASESGQELFAPDGIAFARQLTKAKRLRIGFTPYNAQPVTADFAVQGFDDLAGLVANTCGWRLTSQ